ncbi:MAG: hypothetical protein CMJ78_01755 [Planctomycetaceae bacterium]|nr:hypothetical protein [Planctomycetaceae bacterium]
MNKAFVKEPEDHGDRCPACGSTGMAVSTETLDALIQPDARGDISESACFCPHPTCTIAYFDQFERIVETETLNTGVYPKDPLAPICACFNFTCEEIADDIHEGGVSRVKAHVQRAQSDEARCSTMAADGQSCVAAVQRYFMQNRKP